MSDDDFDRCELCEGEFDSADLNNGICLDCEEELDARDAIEAANS